MTGFLPDQDFEVRRAKPADLPYLDKLQKRFSNEIGFFPRGWMAEKLAAGRYLLLSINRQPAAFACLSGGLRAPVCVLQHAVDEEMWRQGYGRALFNAVALYTAHMPIPSIRLQVRSNLPANRFWRAIGARFAGVRIRPSARGKPLNCYEFDTEQVFSLSRGHEGPDRLPDPRLKIDFC